MNRTMFLSASLAREACDDHLERMSQDRFAMTGYYKSTTTWLTVLNNAGTAEPDEFSPAEPVA